MSSSGLIYAAIVGLWAAYLVPMWLRRQDELAESGSQDRLFTAMRVLSRRAPAADPVQDDAPALTRRPTQKPASPVRAGSRRRSALLARRRRTVSSLFLAFTAGSALTALYGLAWVWISGTAGTLLSTYIVYLRGQERRRAEIHARRERVDRRRRAVADRAELARGIPRGAGGPGLPPAAVQTSEPVASPAATGADGWRPVPVPLPTYVTAPVAPNGQMWMYEQPKPADRPQPQVYDQYSDLEDRPRAVND